jgi:hypothetical protein
MDDLNQPLDDHLEDIDERGNPRSVKQHHRHPAKRSADLARINALMMQGLTPDEVAVQLNMDRALVGRELAKLNKLWLRQIEEDASSFRAILLHRAMELEAISMESFQDSKEKVVTDHTTGGKNGDSSSVKRYESAGDPAFLNSARECLKLQIQILGLDSNQAPAKAFDKDAFLDEVAKRIEEAKQKPVALPVEAVEVKELEPAPRITPFD